MQKKSLKKLLALVLVIILMSVFAACEFGGKESPTDASSENTDNSAQASEDNRPSYQWPADNAFVQNLTPFTGGKIVEITPKANSVVITIANVEESAFKLYVNTLKQLSYTDIVFENEATYSATKSDSPSSKREGITVSYNAETATMTLDSSIEEI